MKNIKISKENLEWYLSLPKEFQLGMFDNFIETAKILIIIYLTKKP